MLGGAARTSYRWTAPRGIGYTSNVNPRFARIVGSFMVNAWTSVSVSTSTIPIPWVPLRIRDEAERDDLSLLHQAPPILGMFVH